MSNNLDLLTLEWFLPKALIGTLAGYILRIIEHILWSIKAKPGENPLGNLAFSLMILPQSMLFGLTLGYLLLAVMAYKFTSVTVLSISAYLLTSLMAFVATDIRDLVRRISRI